jgi:PAS domain S-box-containing protein
MSIPLRVLVLEDRSDDAELIVLELRRAGFQPDWRRVDTAADYAAALSEPLDLILADYNLPQYNALQALQLSQERRLNIPFIVVTGSMREEVAVECMQHGAADYLIKDRLARLGQSVQRALEQKRLRDESDRAGQALRESEQRYRAIFDGVQDAIFVEALDGRILDANASACEMYGDTRENLWRKTVFDLAPHGQPMLTPDRADSGSSPGRAIETINLRANGERFPVEITWRLTSIDGEQVMLVTVRDITARKQAEQQLRLQSAALEAAANAITITDRAGTIQWANAAFTHLTGFTRDEAIGRNPRELIRSGRQGEDFYRVMWDTILRGQVWHGELINKRKDGRLYTEEMTITPLRSGADITHFIAIKQDVSERHQREFELQSIAEVSAALRAAPARADMFPVILNQTQSLLKASGACLVMYDPATNENVAVLGGGQWSGMSGQRLPAGQGIAGEVIASGRPYVTDNVLADSRVLYRERFNDLPGAICVPLIERETTIGALWVGRHAPFTPGEHRLLMAVADIAANALDRANLVETLEQRVVERTQALAQANERLTELDRLKSKFVSDVSHELRTPLTSLVLYLSLLEHGKPEKRDHYMTALKDQAARLTTLIEDILDLSRLERDTAIGGFARVDLNALIEHVLMTHQPRADAAGLRLIFEPQSDLPVMQGEPKQLSQVITNLVANAVSYTPAGQVLIRTFLEDRHVSVQIADTGLGIEPEDIPHLFERFYRGKRTAQANLPGSGLGLAIVKEIVQAHGGTLDLHSAVGQGSTFTVRFPVLR